MENLQNIGIAQFATIAKTSEKSLMNEPNNLTWRQILGKTFIGLLVGWIISALLFVVLSFVWSMFVGALGQQSGQLSQANPLLPLILLFIGFISTCIGNLSIAGLYNLFYSKKYYDASKTFGLLLLTNGLLLFILAPIYLVFSNDIQTLFIVLWFHVLFSIFISACQIEFSSNPNYSGSSLMGNVIGFAAAILVYSLIYKVANSGEAQQQTYLLMLLPSVLWFGLTPFGAGIREKIYYKFYEMGNNAFYIASPSERTETITEGEKNNDIQDINIEW